MKLPAPTQNANNDSKINQRNQADSPSFSLQPPLLKNHSPASLLSSLTQRIRKSWSNSNPIQNLICSPSDRKDLINPTKSTSIKKPQPLSKPAAHQVIFKEASQNTNPEPSNPQIKERRTRRNPKNTHQIQFSKKPNKQTKPWFLSQTILGSIATGIISWAGVLHPNLAGLQGQISDGLLALATLASVATTIWGRIRATHTIEGFKK